MRQAPLVQRLQVVVLTRGPLGAQLLGGDGRQRGSCTEGSEKDARRNAGASVGGR